MTEVKTAEAPVTQRPWLVLAIMCVGFFMALLDGSIVNIAIPTLIDGLDASYDQVLWIIDGYMLVFSVLLITTGRLGSTDAHSDAWSLLSGLIIIGIAGGATFAPLQQATMDGVNPQLAGAASGVSNTPRQVGGVLGTAVLGALLSARINADLPEEAQEQAAQLPSELRDQFLAAAGSAGNFSPPSVPSGLSVSEADLFRRLGDNAFATSFTHAMHVTFLVAAAVLIAATVLCGLFTTPPRTEPAQETAGEEETRSAPED